MPVLTLASSKGGCGKTTIATSLAAVLAADGVNVALLDAGPEWRRLSLGHCHLYRPEGGQLRRAG
ncbi:MAG: P-loop NTPase [Acetobacteraceae bacterium]|nr:P-loop NTPase [Acetobacteraceae bacterium]